jgi:hypothetical protein
MRTSLRYEVPSSHYRRRRVLWSTQAPTATERALQEVEGVRRAKRMTAEFTPPTLPDPPAYGDDPVDYLTRVYLIFTQGLFKQMPTGSWKWSDDEKLTEIAITDQAPYPRDRLEQRPAIITMRGQLQYGNLSLDKMRDVDWKTGKKTRTDLCACTMSLVCLAKLDTEAQKIAWILMRHLRTFKEMLQKYGRFHKIADEISISPVSPPSGAVISGEGDESSRCVRCRARSSSSGRSVPSPPIPPWLERSMHSPVAALAPPDTTGVRQRDILRTPHGPRHADRAHSRCRRSQPRCQSSPSRSKSKRRAPMAATELPRPGVEVVQEFQSASPTIVRPTLVPFVCGPAKEIIDVLNTTVPSTPTRSRVRTTSFR